LHRGGNGEALTKDVLSDEALRRVEAIDVSAYASEDEEESEV